MRTLDCLSQLLPAVTAFMDFCIGVSAPCVPGSSPLSLPQWIPGQCLPGDVAGWLPEGVVNPAPLFFYGCEQPLVVCCPPQVLIAYLLWPLDTEDFAQTAVDKSLEVMEC